MPAINVAPCPARLTWHEAAALNLAGLTAWRCAVTCAGAAPGRSVLVHGAGSGVATFAIQIASALGARVFVTSSSEAKLEHARALGAEGGVLYTDADWPARLRALAGGGLDAAIDSYGGPALAPLLEALRPGGTLVNFGDTGGDDATIPVAAVYWHWRTLRGTTLGIAAGVPRPARARRDGCLAARDRPGLPARADRRSGRPPLGERPLRQGRPADRLAGHDQVVVGRRVDVGLRLVAERDPADRAGPEVLDEVEARAP